MSLATRPVFVTHCFGCGRRLHGPTEERMVHRAARHAGNCQPLKKMHGMILTEPQAAP